MNYGELKEVAPGVVVKVVVVILCSIAAVACSPRNVLGEICIGGRDQVPQREGDGRSA